MDGLASLAAAATIIGDYSDKSSAKSPGKRKQSPKIESPKKRKKKSLTAVQRTMLDFEEDAVDLAAQTTQASHPLIEADPQFTRAMECMTPAVRKRCCREWFYTTLDRLIALGMTMSLLLRDYFCENEFISCLKLLGLSHYTMLSRYEWGLVKGMMGCVIGRPRRFSQAFLLSERYKLQHHRQRIRHIQQSELVPSPAEFPYEVYRPIRVGDYVTVYHSPSASLQRGQVLTVQSMSIYGTSYRVQFDRVDLGSDLVNDEYMAVHGNLEVMGPFRRGQRTAGVCELGHDSEDSKNTVAAQVEEEDVTPAEAMNRLWARLLLEAEEMVTMQAGASDDTTLQGLKRNVAPCMASLLFVQNCPPTSRVLPQEDIASFLAEKVRSHLETDDMWAQKASMLFLLAVNYKI